MATVESKLQISLAQVKLTEIGWGMGWEGGGRLGGTLRDFTDFILEWKSVKGFDGG
jgi:hypothetical protein